MKSPSGNTTLAVLASLAAMTSVSACGSADKAPPLQATTSSGTTSSGVGSSGTGGAGGQGGSSGTGGASAELTSFCASVVAPFCEALFACCTDQTELDHFGGSVNLCATQFHDQCLAQGSSAGIDQLLTSGDTLLNTAELAACAADLEALSTDCSQPPKYMLHRCWGAFEGQVSPGGSCGVADADLSWIECQDGACTSGTCIAFLDSSAGCLMGANPPAYCNLGDGEQCVTDGIVLPTCGEPLVEGESCVNNTSLYPYQCWSLNCSSGQCQPPTADLLCADGH
jgi:hypothetical protein